jgi:regulator of protease activity HflC (stomatin/prohibitin superfamily)
MPVIKTRFFPVLGLIAAGIFLNYLTRFRFGVILAGLSGFTFTTAYFLVLITVFYELNKHSEWIKQKIFKLIKKFIESLVIFFNKFYKRKTNASVKEQTIFIPQDDLQNDPPQDSPQGSPYGGLIEIKKKNISQERQESVSIGKRIFGILFIAGFLAIAFWRISSGLKTIPLSYTVLYGSNIVVAVLTLIAPCICFLYLKIRKDDSSYPPDKISRDLLNLFSYTSFIYAALIAATSVLNVNFLLALQWVFYAATAYLILALAVNILLSFLKGDVLNFDYALFPKFSRAAWEAQVSKWKVSLKSLYTIRYTLQIFPALVLGLIFILFISTSFFVVQPHQQAAIYHFGKLSPSSIKSEGVHVKFPWPIDKAEIYDVHRAASMQIGYESSKDANFLWGQGHDGGEYMLLLGNGNEIAAVNIKLVYVISDLYSYIKTSAKAQDILSAAAYNALMSRTINTTLDSFLNTDRNSLSESVAKELAEFCKTEKLGLSVVQVIVESIHPPVDIADVYQRVVSASIDKTTAITRAEIYAGTKVMEARRQSQTAIDHARAVQFSRVSDAQKEAAVFDAAGEAYRISGGSFDLVRQLDVYEKIIKNNKVYVFSPGMQRDISKFFIGKVNTVNLSNITEGEEP